MKKIISVLLSLVLIGSIAQAQDKQEKKSGHDWREKVRAEQVAFITSELDLSDSEAQAFWPVYNDIQNQRREAFKASGEAFKALQEGIDGADVNKLLDKYLDSKKSVEKIETEAITRYMKVLSVEKVAKLLVAEEKFRHQQIGKLGQGGRPGSPRGPKAPNGQLPPSPVQE